MTKGDTVHYYGETYYDRGSGRSLRYHHRVGRFVRVIEKGRHKGLIEIEHGGTISDSHIVRIEPTQIIGDA